MTRRRVIARGSEPNQLNSTPTSTFTRDITREVKLARATPAVGVETPKLVRTRPAMVMKTGSQAASLKATRQVMHAKNLFALLDPEPEFGQPERVVHDEPAADIEGAYESIDIAVSRKETSRTRRLKMVDNALVELAPDGTARTGRMPLVDWSEARTPSIEIDGAYEKDVSKVSYRRGVVMGAAIATFVATALAVVAVLFV